MQQFADHTIPYDYLQYNIENILNVQIEGTPPDNVKIRNSMAAIHLKKNVVTWPCLPPCQQSRVVVIFLQFSAPAVALSC